MNIVEAHCLGKDWSGDPVLEAVSFAIPPREKIGCIGRNGCGKTTLLEIIAGIDTDFSGSLGVQKGRRIGYVPQYLKIDLSLTVSEFLLQGISGRRRRLGELESAMSTAAGDELAVILDKYQRERDVYEAESGDTAESRMERFLAGAGLGEKSENTLESLSGGERNILTLIKVMISLPDLLVLDEPGNHLDYAGLAWLERFLKEQKCAVLIVSHNRYLLDRVVDRIWELDHCSLSESAGNYSMFRLEKMRNLGAGGKQYKAEQKKIARLTELVRRFEEAARNTADPAWGKRLKARRTQLEKVKEQATDKPDIGGGDLVLTFSENASRADIAVEVSGYSRAFGELRLFDNAGLFIGTGERVALIGPNGSGKSTFLKDLIGEGSWDNRVLKVGPSMVIGYCAQHQEVFDPRGTVLQEFEKIAPGTRDDIYRFLSRFLFSWEDLERQVGTLSGGEKNRLQIARAIYLKANFLILDEPTNHLDITAREAIESGLEDFAGTLLVVSHDRYFLDKVADRVVEISGEKFVEYRGNFSEYWAVRGALSRRGGRNIRRRAGDLKPGKRPEDNGGRRKEIEARITRLEAEQRGLETQIDAAYRNGDYRSGGDLSKRLRKVVSMIDSAYTEWDGM